MKVIAIDTSTEYLALGISEDQRILSAQKILLERKHSTDLLPILEKTLKKLRLSIRGIDGFIVGLGPGSFTGLRVGISIVKVMAVALGKPIVGVPTLDCLAEAAPGEGDRVAPLVDAKRQQVYAALYERKNGFLRKKISENVIPPETFLKTLGGKTLFVGDGALLYRETIQRVLGNNANFTDAAYDSPNPSTLLRLGLKQFEKKCLEDPRTLVPLYLYPKNCMIIGTVPHKHP